jgi:hypothetical protein
LLIADADALDMESGNHEQQLCNWDKAGIITEELYWTLSIIGGQCLRQGLTEFIYNKFITIT